MLIKPQLAEYIWLDGTEPTPKFRSKIRVLYGDDDISHWSYDGSSTDQASGSDSDIILKPTAVYNTSGTSLGVDFLVLCNTPGIIVPSNIANFKVGFEQEYFIRPLLDDSDPETYLSLIDRGMIAIAQPQGPFYCGIGANNIATKQRQLVMDHMKLCLSAEINLHGLNAEVAPNQWEFQTAASEPETACNDLMMARYVLERMAENIGFLINFDPKPMGPNWNGSGLHTNFSYDGMSQYEVIAKFKAKHKEHIAVYGTGNEKRLTGKHETCSINEFRAGVADRTASLRVPRGKEYIEDRRPAANADPYKIVSRILQTLFAGDSSQDSGIRGKIIEELE